MNRKFNSYVFSILILCLTSTQVTAASGIIDVYNLSIQHDAKLAQAKASYQAEQEGVGVARGNLLPQISINGSYSVNDGDNNAADATTTSAGVSLQQSIYQHDYWARYGQAKSRLKQEKYNLKIAEQDLILRLAEHYFAILLAQVDLKFSLSQEKANKNQWQKARVSANVGLSNNADVLQAKSSYDLSKSIRISSQNNLDIAYENLTKLTGKVVKNLKKVSVNSRIKRKKLSIKSYERLALKNNLAILKAREQVNVAKKEISAQQSAHWPKIYVQANYTEKSYTDFEPSYSANYQDKNNSNVGIYASMPIFSGGSGSAKVAQARANAKVSKIALRDAKDIAKLNARVAVRNLQRGYELVEANRAAVKSSNAFLDTAKESYKVGLKDLFEVLTARTNKFQAQKNLTSSLHNLALSKLRLAKSVGTLNIDKLHDIEKNLH